MTYRYKVFVDGLYVGTLSLTCEKAKELRADGFVLRMIRRFV
jgi:hypothetical protein